MTCPRVTGSSVSGMRIFEMEIDAGIDMTDAVTKFCGGTPMLIYADNTEPAIVENPEVMVRSGRVSYQEGDNQGSVDHSRNSDSVMRST